MKAAILSKQNYPLIVANIELPSLDVGQVLINVAYSGICGKQLEEISGKRGEDPYLPHLLGHEGSGIVESVGPGVNKVKIGDHVVLHWIKGPGIDSVPPRFDWEGREVSAGWVTTFSEYTIVSENRLTRIEDDIPMDVAALLGCAVTTGLGIVFNNANVKPGESLAVFGVGGVGINVIQGASLVNAYPIIAVDVHENKLSQALQFGATHTINANNSDPEEILLKLSAGVGIDAIVDTTGNSQVRQTAYRSTSNTGKTIFAGVPHYQEQITIDSFPLHFGRQVIGSHGGETRPDRDINRYLNLYKLGKLRLKEQISHCFSLDDINEAIKIVQKGDANRCLIEL